MPTTGPGPGEREIPSVPLRYDRAVLTGAVVREKLRTTAVRTGRTTPPRISKQRCPSVVELSAPHPIVQPIEGEDYTVLAPPPPEKRTRWRVDVTRDGRRLAGHRRDVGREVAVKRVDVVAESGA